MKQKTINIIAVISVVVLSLIFVFVVTNKDKDASSPETQTTENTTENTTEDITEMPTNQFVSAPENYFEDALFIGDSRTVGLCEYGKIDDADFFASVGMNVYKINKEKVSVEGVGKLTLAELLNAKKYGKVYIMIGINELGYNRNTTIKKYNELVDLIKKSQPNAIIYIQANIHVGKKMSDSDDLFRNSNIDSFNKEISLIANDNDIFYLNVNEIFDDKEGNLDTQYTHDGVHLLAKYYIMWSEWLFENVIVK